ncbi:DUF599 family protein [Methylobrevis sp. L22]|uniref:DUF599 family protein n=1 Tax=Methylobrevis albus TaxID=2793297 RepID=A0A931MY01_9HYPH|nr:DUF599 family protein [Methylobrevis albus]
MLSAFSVPDLLAAAWFLLAWFGYGAYAESSRWHGHSLSQLMNLQRTAWIRQTAARDLRMIDTQIVAGLQNGTAFFASTSLLAIGGGFALLNASDRVLEVVQELPFDLEFSRAVWETKVVGLLVIYAYAFFKFGWAYRLFNYCSILIGALPPKDQIGTPEMEGAIRRAADLNIQAGQHFNRGLRAFFVSIGYLGWFLGPVAFIVTTTVVLAVLAHRQFRSGARKAIDPA